MKNNLLRRACALLACLALALSLAGCGDGGADAQAAVAQGQSQLEAGEYAKAAQTFAALLEKEPGAAAARGLVAAREGLYAADTGEEALAALIDAYGALYATDNFTAEEYLRLGELYALSGNIPGQRNALERAVRLAPSQETADRLFALVADAAADSEDIAAAAGELMALLEQEDLDGAVALALAPEWKDTMMPALTAGTRRYTLQGEGETLLKLEVGYAGGVFSARAWYAAPGKDVLVLRAGADEVCCGRAPLSGKNYDGSFHLEYCEGATGNKGVCDGTFTAGLCTGPYTEAVAFGAGGADAGALWPARGEGEKTPYAGAFTAEGHTTAEQQYAVSAQGGVVYAYDGGLGYLCLYPAGGADGSYVFTAASLGLPPYPAW